ncbi:MAG: response regulator [Pyrinomonadaceae bacterium]
MVIDEDASMRRSLQRTFRSEGYHVVTATDAPGALRMLHQERCDLIILDVEMPGVSGLALCRILRVQTTTKQTPSSFIRHADDEACKVEALCRGRR